MSKIASPILLRSKITPNYINNIYIKLTKKLSYLTYFKFFQLLFNFLYLLKSKFLLSKFNKNLLYINCNYYDFYNLNISVNFSKLIKNKLTQIFINIFLFYNYINYFTKFYLYATHFHINILIKKSKYLNNNLFYIIHLIKYYIKQKKNLKYKLTKFINILLDNKFRDNYSIKGIKISYSGCFSKGGFKTKTITYMKGNILFSTLTADTLYINDCVKTTKGIVGIKIWIYIETN